VLQDQKIELFPLLFIFKGVHFLDVETKTRVYLEPRVRELRTKTNITWILKKNQNQNDPLIKNQNQN